MGRSFLEEETSGSSLDCALVGRDVPWGEPCGVPWGELRGVPWGKLCVFCVQINATENRAVMHVALRAPKTAVSSSQGEKRGGGG